MKVQKLILFFSILISIFESCSSSYNLNLIMDNRCRAEAGSEVLIEGKVIGKIKKITEIDTNMVIANLIIYDGFKIPKANNVKCMRNILGSTYVMVSFKPNEPVDESAYLLDKDTLYGEYKAGFKDLDSASIQVIFNKLGDLKTTLDSVLEESDSIK